MNGFTDNHMAQYKIISDDMRFYSDQRFKITTVFLVVFGFLVNSAMNRESAILGVIGLTISYFCFRWDAATTRWWGTLIEHAKKLEDLAKTRGQMIDLYNDYRSQNPVLGIHTLAHLNPTRIVAGIYALGFICSGVYFVVSLIHWKWW